jgi:hypothetical protein
MILYELAHRGKRPYWQVTWTRASAVFSEFVAHLLPPHDSFTEQLNQDWAIIRQKIMEGERPKFEDPTAPAE